MTPEYDKAYRSFLNFTLAKKREAFKDFSEGQKDAFNLIPYVLQGFEPKRFGYVEGQPAPYGIHNYKFNDEVKGICKKYLSSRERAEEPKAVENAPIVSLSIMGSAGSIAQTEGSDLDYWLTIKDGMKPEDRRLLQYKLTAIEKFCWQEMNAEVHFFVSTAKDVRDNNFGSVDKESCGTALGKLLKEEYYRTSLHVAGKVPLWWLAPYNASDDIYKKIPESLSQDGPGVGRKDFVDFGNIRSIPHDEFVGGGMWQLNKGAGSPFKSALKMGLLVEYADRSKPRDLLAQMLKRRMLENPGDMDLLDPYRMMLERVLQYAEDKGDKEGSWLLQRCLFIKMETKISRWWESKVKPPHRTVRTLLEMVRSWGWNLKEVKRWEEFDLLPVREVVDFKRRLERYMFKSLQSLREGREGLESQAVTDEDFRKMTQRLTTIFNPDPSRTEWFYPPYNSMIKADAFTIQEEDVEGEWKWILFSGVVDDEGLLHGANARKRLNVSENLSDLVTWMLYNQLVKDDKKISVRHRREVPFTGNLKRLARSYRSAIGKPSLPTLDSDAFAKDSCPKAWLVAVNLVPVMEMEETDEDAEEEEGTDVSQQEPSTKTETVEEKAQLSNLIAGELSEALSQSGYSEKAEELKKHAVNEGGVDESVKIGSKTIPLRAGRVSREEDPLNAGPEEGSIFHELFVIELNSWGEIFTRNLRGAQPIADAIVQICDANLSRGQKDVPIHCELGFGPYHQSHADERLKTLIESTVSHLCSADPVSPVSVFQLDGKFFQAIRAGDSVEMRNFDSLSDALLRCNMENTRGVRLQLDESQARFSLHNKVLLHWRKGENLLHLMEGKEGCMIVCIDQTGRYFYDALEKSDFNVQWPPLLLSVLGAIRRLPKELGKGKLRITRGSLTGEEGAEITDKLFTVFQKLKDKLPKTSMKVIDQEARSWLKKGGREDMPASVEEELQHALELHSNSQGEAPFILSSVNVDPGEGKSSLWSPALQLQLRQALIRAGRRKQNEMVGV